MTAPQMTPVDEAVRNAIAALPTLTLRERISKAVAAAIAEAYAVGFAAAEAQMTQRIMGNKFLREHYAAEMLREYREANRDLYVSNAERTK